MIASGNINKSIFVFLNKNTFFVFKMIFWIRNLGVSVEILYKKICLIFVVWNEIHFTNTFKNALYHTLQKCFS